MIAEEFPWCFNHEPRETEADKMDMIMIYRWKTPKKLGKYKNVKTEIKAHSKHIIVNQIVEFYRCCGVLLIIGL